MLKINFEKRIEIKNQHIVKTSVENQGHRFEGKQKTADFRRFTASDTVILHSSSGKISLSSMGI